MFDIDGTAAHVAYERVAKPIDVLLPFREVFARIDAIGFEQPTDELIDRHHSSIRQEIGDVHRAVIDDRSAPTAFYANLCHQGMEGLSIRHRAMLNEWPHSSKRLTVRNDNNWAVAANPDRRYILHMVDRTMLQFDYDLAQGRVVTAVLGSDAGSGAWDSLAVVMAERALVLRVYPDTDELIVDFGPAPVLEGRWRTVNALSSIKGSELGWCWIGRNYLGYLDMFTLSFSGLDPQYCFVGEASNITIRRLSPAS